MSMERAMSENNDINNKCKVSPTSASLKVLWDEHATPELIECYEIKFREHGTKRFESRHVSKDDNGLEIDGLVSNTLYQINVYWCDEEGTNHLLFQKQCKTEESKTTFLMENTLPDKTRKPFLYHLKPMDVYSSENDQRHTEGDCDVPPIRVLDMISEHRPSVREGEEKTLLLLGATGTGKTTLIDALINYIAGVSYNDNHRFTLINKTNKEKERGDKQHESQTSSVTVYRIPRMQGLNVSCGVNIIDTPGFNDTRDNFDKNITEQVKELFQNKVTHLDAILLVVPSPTTRLTTGQQHVFSSILDMFGDNIKQNIFLAVTWDDLGELKCKAVLDAANIPVRDDGVFRFNNSNVLSEFKTDAPQTSKIDQEFWNARRNTFSMLFQKLETTPKTTVTSSIEVMRARLCLEIQLVALEESICEQAQHIANYKQHKIEMGGTERDGSRRKAEATNITLLPEMHLQFNGKYSLNCNKCRKTCHRNCWVLLDSLKWTCEAMKKENYKCIVCKGGCCANDHEFSRDVYELKYVEEMYSHEDAVKMPVKQGEHQGEHLQRLKETLQQITDLIAKINEKALSKNALTPAMYIQNLADKEDKEKKAGYEMRVHVQKAIAYHLKNKYSIGKLSMDFLLKD